MNVELKPCPFCGGDAELRSDEANEVYDVGCCKCNAHGASFDVWWSDGDAATNARTAWNMRKKPNDDPQAEFKKCPFCGEDSEMQSDLGIYTVQCRGCGAFGDTFDDWHVGESAWKDAKAAWNQRVDKSEVL